MKFIITFNDVSGSLRTEQVLKRFAYPCVIDAAPRGLGAGCVYIIRTAAQTQEEIASILESAEIGWANIIADEAG
ncbi:MAG: DUF3343 domain-containing protein [Spirochaetaceae bacterium]|nr:DUF3343 domain-containing protein [Spirochaetaceae bacterium]